MENKTIGEVPATDSYIKRMIQWEREKKQRLGDIKVITSQQRVTSKFPTLKLKPHKQYVEEVSLDKERNPANQ